MAGWRCDDNETNDWDGTIKAKKFVGDGSALKNVSGVVLPLSHTDSSKISNVGTNTHAQIDTHIGDSSNPHGTTLTQDEIDFTIGVGDRNGDGQPTINGINRSSTGIGVKATADWGSDAIGFYSQAIGSEFYGVNSTFKVKSSGIVSAPKQSSAIAYLSANQSVNSASWTILAANTELTDAQAEYDKANYKFTPNILSGNYMVFANIGFSTMAINDVMAVAIYLNGSLYTQTKLAAPVAGDYYLPLSAIVPATAKFEIYVYHNHGSARDIIGTANASMVGFNRLN